MNIGTLAVMLAKLGIRRFLKEVDENTIPAANTVPSGYEVWHSTFNVTLRSNGTRWLAKSPFIAAQAVRTDQVVGTATESLLHSVDISAAVRYMGPKGVAVFDSGWSHTSSANSKACYTRLATTAGIGGTGLLTLTVSSNTASTTTVKRLRAQSSESSQSSSNASLAGEGSQANNLMSSTLNFASGGDTVIASYSAAVTGAGENVTLRWYRITIEPGY